ncbi:MAG: alkaline phosphatase D family protein [Bacteroidota bacterium]
MNRLTTLPSHNRRSFLKKLGLGSGAVVSMGFMPDLLQARQAPAIHLSTLTRPTLPAGISSGDIRANSAMIWSKTDRPSRMHLRWSTTESMKDSRIVNGPATLKNKDFTAKMYVSDLPADQEIFYEVSFQSLEDLSVRSAPMKGRFRSAPSEKRDVRFLWSGDTCGQGYGINPDWGGLRIYESMRKLTPDFFLHSGDTIYADGPIESEKQLADGSIWKNITTEATSKVAESLEEFRGNYAYNLMDHNLRQFHQEVPIIYQWDDHETSNNWYPGETLEEDQYKVKQASLLAARARQAFLEYTPIRSNGIDPERIYRKIPYGPLLDVFVVDLRSYRGPNTANVQTQKSDTTEIFGKQQIHWLIEGLKSSSATWKVIASDMPIGLLVKDYHQTFEGIANGKGGLLGRELEVADILSAIKKYRVNNVVWLTADVHYTAAHHYDPNRADFQDFLPFYEFVSGPLNSGTFGPGELDQTFGPEVLYYKAPPSGQFNLPPSAGMQFFGDVFIDAQSEQMTVTLRDLEGDALYSVDIAPE